MEGEGRPAPGWGRATLRAGVPGSAQAHGSRAPGFTAPAGAQLPSARASGQGGVPRRCSRRPEERQEPLPERKSGRPWARRTAGWEWAPTARTAQARPRSRRPPHPPRENTLQEEESQGHPCPPREATGTTGPRGLGRPRGALLHRARASDADPGDARPVRDSLVPEERTGRKKRRRLPKPPGSPCPCGKPRFGFDAAELVRNSSGRERKLRELPRRRPREGPAGGLGGRRVCRGRTAATGRGEGEAWGSRWPRGRRGARGPGRQLSTAWHGWALHHPGPCLPRRARAHLEQGV